MEEDRPHHVRDSADDSFGFAVLWGCVGARETKLDALAGEELVEFVIVELTTIVTLKGLYGEIELCFSKVMKLDKVPKHLGFEFQGDDP